MKTRICWHMAVLLSSLLALIACGKSPFTPAHKKRYMQDDQRTEIVPAARSKNGETEAKPEGGDAKPINDGDQGDVEGEKPAADRDKAAGNGGNSDLENDGHSSDIFKDNPPSLGSRRPLRPLDVPMAGGPMGGPSFVPPPVDPFTGGPIVPLPPPPPPLEDGPVSPIVPFFVKPICGNKFLTTGEECEDQNTINNDGCSIECKKEFCGNGLIEIGEQCDNGVGRNMVQGPNCDQYCQFIICGDYYVTGNEQCDDGNREDCDGCSRDCRVEDPCALALTCPCDTLNANAAAAAMTKIKNEEQPFLGETLMEGMR